MKVVLVAAIFVLMIIIIFFSILCFVEYKLAKNRNKYIGLIIPILCFIISIMLCVNYLGSLNESYIVTSGGEKYTYQTKTEADEKFEELMALEKDVNVKHINFEHEKLSTIISSFIFINIGTTIFLLIYIYTKKNIKDYKNMYINDL